MAAAGGDLHDPRACAVSAGAGPLRIVQRSPVGLPDRSLSSAVPARCAAVHFLFDDRACGTDPGRIPRRSEEHTSELQSLMRISYAVFCLKKKNKSNTNKIINITYSSSSSFHY